MAGGDDAISEMPSGNALRRAARQATAERVIGAEATALIARDPHLAVERAQRAYNEAVRLYRDTLIRHRRSMLSLNTAVGQRILP